MSAMFRIGAALLVFFSVHEARADVDPARRGFYLGAAGTFAVYTEAEEEFVKDLGAQGRSGRVDAESPLGFVVRAGYRAHPRIATELSFEWLSRASVDYDLDPEVPPPDPPSPAPSTFDHLDTWTLTANAKGFLLTGTYQPFLLAGVGMIHSEVSGTPRSDTLLGLATRFGAGFDIYLTESVVVTLGAAYVLPFGDASHLDYGLVDWGLSWRF